LARGRKRKKGEWLKKEGDFKIDGGHLGTGLEENNVLAGPATHTEEGRKAH